MSIISEHEALVARFFEQCGQDDPARYREVCERHPVLSDEQMRARREIVISQFLGQDQRREMGDLFYSSTGTENGSEGS